MIGWLLIAALSVIVLFPDTPTAKTLRRWLVDEPARLLREATPRQLARWLLTIVVVIVIAAAAPEFLALALSFGDVGVMLELFAALALLSFNRSLLSGLKQIARLAKLTVTAARRLISGGRRASLRQRSGRTRPGKRPPSDDAGPPAWGDLAAA